MHNAHKGHEESFGAQKMSRRSFVKGAGGSGLAALSVSAGPPPAGKAAKGTLEGANLAMVIDLQRCTGCGGCFIACKSENNVQAGARWAWIISETVGKFPNVRFEFIPALCNQCENAPCASGCPTGAMHKGIANITMHAPEKCIGCRTCIAMCPYGAIWRNSQQTHRFWRSTRATIKGCTSAPSEVAPKVNGNVIPHYNPHRERSLAGAGLRYKGIVEKCTFCDHRAREGKLPHCVVACPAHARVFGDLNDPDSQVSRLLNKYRPWRLKEHLGTEPKVFYIRAFNPGNYRKTKGSV
jgi:molybdopterin-containing oxidoreductase family iron-sulfur binding subunit